LVAGGQAIFEEKCLLLPPFNLKMQKCQQTAAKCLIISYSICPA